VRFFDANSGKYNMQSRSTFLTAPTDSHHRSMHLHHARPPVSDLGTVPVQGWA
jgi:hypothetical protein